MFACFNEDRRNAERRAADVRKRTATTAMSALPQTFRKPRKSVAQRELGWRRNRQQTGDRLRFRCDENPWWRVVCSNAAHAMFRLVFVAIVFAFCLATACGGTSTPSSPSEPT